MQLSFLLGYVVVEKGWCLRQLTPYIIAFQTIASSDYMIKVTKSILSAQHKNKNKKQHILVLSKTSEMVTSKQTQGSVIISFIFDSCCSCKYVFEHAKKPPTTNLVLLQILEII